MDFDLSKENIQPLRGGRNASQLGVALQAQTNPEFQTTLLQERESFESRIASYEGDDPLALWYEYISWIENSYPKHGHEGNLVPLLEQCLSKFDGDARYIHDRRHCKLLIKFIDFQANPIELFHILYSKGICTHVADLYKAWAYYHEAVGDYQNAHKILEMGKHKFAQPVDELNHALTNLVMAAGQHMLHDGQVDYNLLLEKRQALTSLQTYKPGRVGSVRQALPGGPGTIGGASASGVCHNNAACVVYEDDGEGATGAAAAAQISILTAAKRQEVTKENTLKPGPWTTVPVKKRHLGQKNAPSFTVLEDSLDGQQSLHVDFPTSSLENYSDWIVNLTIPEPKDDRMVPMYPKKQVYAEILIEYSLEEIRARRYRKNNSALNSSNGGTMNMDYSLIKNNSQLQEQYEQTLQHSIHNQFGNLNEQSLQTFLPVSHALDATEHSRMENKALSQLQTSGQQPFIWETSAKSDTAEASVMVAPKSPAISFNIYEESNIVLQEQVGPKGSAMKTPFKDLNAEDLAETGSRGGMDIAAAAPVDSAKRLEIYEDENSSPFNRDEANFNDLSCNTQMFDNLNKMRVSTPQEKPRGVAVYDAEAATNARKQLFNETQDKCSREEKILSTILEETKSFRSTSSSSGANSKSSLNCQSKPGGMTTISEEHNSYLAQNLKANAELRTSLFRKMGDIHSPSSSVPSTSTQLEQRTPNRLRTGAPTSASSPASIPINFIPSDPFKKSLIDDLLRRINFPGDHVESYFVLPSIPKIFMRKEITRIGTDKYVIEKQLGRGNFGTVFRCLDIETGKNMALKVQRPPNKWEFYICRELQKRLANHPLRERFMDVRVGYFSEQYSVLISDYMPYGSLLDVANMVKTKSGRAMKESLCIYFSLDMLKVVCALHQAQIIHADIKPDNFLIRLLPNDTIILQLIDFGCSIDMTLFPPGASFTRKVTTEDFVCCEMLDGRPWNYHTDLFCVAATAHVLLFEKYIQMKKTDDNWAIVHRLPRYARVDLWNMFFSTLLNQQSGPADCTALQAFLDDSLNHKFDDYYSDLRYLSNILKNR